MDDLISRQAAIANAISGLTREIDGEKWIRVSEVRESIKTLPPAQPEQKTARWIRMKDSDDGYCSNCKCDMPLFREDWTEWKYCATEFCPNCGAKMEGAEENE